MKKYDADIPEGRPSEEKRAMKAHDVMLRDHGFHIKGRPKSGGSVWTGDGIVYTYNEAVEISLKEVEKK